jgi:hypothetical protein
MFPEFLPSSLSSGLIATLDLFLDRPKGCLCLLLGRPEGSLGLSLGRLVGDQGDNDIAHQTHDRREDSTDEGYSSHNDLWTAVEDTLSKFGEIHHEKCSDISLRDDVGADCFLFLCPWLLSLL